MNLTKCVDTLCLLSPLDLAAEWDNVGLLLESGQDVNRIMLTLDLTKQVAAEAVDQKADLLIAYHPPIFIGLKRLTTADPMTDALLRLFRAGVSVFSPHTALDAAPNGVSDWLTEPFSEATVTPVEGSGRLLEFPAPIQVDALARKLQNHLNLPYLRHAPAASASDTVRSLAICPGAGASILREMNVDAVFTGEMRHHDILAISQRGVHVFLSEHTHTERPYLQVYKQRLLEVLPPEISVLISSLDAEPVQLRPFHA